tara:strand:+ start:983 stop:1237 length:255 start_codon:yes stop_codon:yes gene_type:complete
MSTDDIIYQLLANPYHMKHKEKKLNKYSIEDDIVDLLCQRFKGYKYYINDNNKPEIFSKIENIFIEVSISNILEDIISIIEVDE